MNDTEKIEKAVTSVIEKFGGYHEGNRNGVIFQVAGYCKNLKVDQLLTEKELIHRFQESDFTKREIKATIRSAYNNNGSKGKHSQNIAKQPIQTTNIQTRALNENELAYWGQYKISQRILEIYKVFAVEYYQVGNHTVTTDKDNPIFAYQAGENSYKIYRPFAKKGQNKFYWIGGKPDDWYFGLEYCKGSEQVYITAGEKDVLTLVCQGAEAFSLNSETASIPQDLVNKLKKQYREVILLYDSDQTGQDYSKKLCEDHGFTRGILPDKVKDISDLIKAGGSIDEVRNEEPKVINLLDKYDDCIVDITKPPVNEPYFMYINGVRVGSFGSYTLVTGKAKSRKTFLNIYIVAAALNGEHGNITITLPEEKNKILYCDTEQGGEEGFITFKKILLTSGLGIEQQPKNIIYLNLRPFTPAERTQRIDEFVRHTYGLALVWIDGIRDLVIDINSPEEATKIATMILKWTGEQHIHIFPVLHLNKGDNNARGHLGTELVNKAQTIINIEKNSDAEPFSVVTFTDGRGKGFEPFGIGYDDNELPILIDDITPGKPGRRIISPKDWGPIEHSKRIRSILKDNGIPYGDLIISLKEVYNIGTNKAKEFISYFIDEKMIHKVKGKYVHGDENGE